MKICSGCSINPEAFCDYTQKAFLERFRGKASPEELKAVHKKCLSFKKKAKKIETESPK